MNKKISNITTTLFLILAIILICVLAVLTSHESANVSQVPNGQAGSAYIRTQTNNSTTATISALSITRPYDTADAALSNARIINWQTNNYQNQTGVDINLLKKTSNSPAAYSLVRTIASNVPNTGSYTWTPSATDTGPSMYVEVTCTRVPQASACQVAAQPISVNQ